MMIDELGERMAIDTVIHTNRHSIDRVLNAGLPVALVFWDKNRTPVKANDSELDRLADKYSGRALIARVNAEEEGELLGRFQIDGVPSFAFVDKGVVIERTQADEPGYVDAWLSHLTAGDPKPQRPASPTSGKPVNLTDANFNSAVSGPTPVLVDFWAEWCGPCRTVAPSVEQLAQEFDGRAVVGKLNVDENPVTAGQYGIRSIPSLLIFKNGQIVDQIVGAQPLPVLRQHLTAQV